MNSIGLINISAKPFHKGHEHIINKSINENYHTFVFISFEKRKIKNKSFINKIDSKFIFDNFINKFYSLNEKITFIYKKDINDELNNSPIKNMFLFISYFNNDKRNIKIANIKYDFNDIEKIKIYSGEIEKYFNKENLFNYIELVQVDRNEVPISGTIMREYLFNNRKNDFICNLPLFLDKKDKDEIWKLLYKNYSEFLSFLVF